MEMRPTGDASYFGKDGSHNEVLFEDNAVITNSNSGATYLGHGPGAHDNRVTVRSGASAAFANAYGQGSLLVGSGGGDDNAVVVSNGTLTAPSLSLGYSAGGDGDGACGNRAHFGDGARGDCAYHLDVGRPALCDSNELLVAGAGSLVQT